MKKREITMSFKDIENLKENLRYDPKTGEFFRKFHQSRPAAFCWANNNATIKVTGKDYAKYHSVWRAAVYFSHGYYPAFEDSIVFKDGNNANFRIDNLLVVHPSEDECTDGQPSHEKCRSLSTHHKKLYGVLLQKRFVYEKLR